MVQFPQISKDNDSISILHKHTAECFDNSKRLKKPVAALDVNIILEDFLFRNPRYSKGDQNEEDAVWAKSVVDLIRDNKVTGFVPMEWAKDIQKTLHQKYNVKIRSIEDAMKYMITSGIKFSLKRNAEYTKQIIDAVSSNFVHKNDSKIIEASISNNVDVLITDDRRIIKNPMVTHYVPILTSRNFVKAYNMGIVNRPQLQQISYNEYLEQCYGNGRRDIPGVM